MITKLTEFQKIFNDHQIIFSTSNHNKIIKGFTCHLITEKSQADDLQNLLNKSEIIMIDEIDEQNDQYFVIFVDNAIIFIHEIDLLSNLFIKKERYCTIIASEKINKELLSHELHLDFCEDIEEYEKQFYNEIINKFSENFSISKRNQKFVKEIWKLISPSFSAYFINKSYKKLEQNKISKTKIEINDLNEDDIIHLNLLGNTYTSSVELIYHIELGQLFALKSFRDSEGEKLYKRELKNYERICHPALPRFYGKIEKGENRYLIIEYIRGKSLANIDTKNLKPEEKINFIFQIMFIIEYLQNESLIYRDLKPNNFIVDEEKRVILIDFDRMIGIDEQENPKEDSTKDFDNIYQAPEVRNGIVTKYTYEEDVYSLGFLIYFIFFGKDPEIIKEEKTKRTLHPFDEFSGDYFKLRDICTICTSEDPSKRPKITKLIDLFYEIFSSFMQKEAGSFDLSEVTINYNKNKYFPYWILFNKYDNSKFQKQFEMFYSNENINQNLRNYIEEYSNYLNINHLISQFFLGIEYYPKEYFLENIRNFIHFFEIPENSKSQFCLGYIYLIGDYTSRDINKAIHYLTLAAKKNNAKAQNILGNIYYKGKYILRDINKAIHYYSLAANQNNSNAQNNLGNIYYEGKYISRNINKAIHYFTLAANQNDIDAQAILGSIYYEGKYILRDINKAIHYLTLAANQNDAIAQNNLGKIYYESKYILRDINKAIHYYSLAANQNDENARTILGTIYYEGKYIPRDINKAIHYYSLAANQNYAIAQTNLGIIYYEGKYIPRDINKAIHYYSLAANQNNANAQNNLGNIYYEGKYISRDINKAIHYYSLAANQNNSNAQNNLGNIYYEGKYILRDINKAIHYLTLAAKQNNAEAQNILGNIYYKGKYISRDINKAIHYYSLAAKQNISKAQNILGNIYYVGKYISRDINKAIHYYSLSANQNNAIAQTNLGIIYYEGKYILRDINKAIHYLILAANQNNAHAQTNLGIIYSEGEYTLRDINKAIHYLTLAANQNYAIAQTNLGFIYSEGEYISRDINKAIHYLTLAAKQNYVIAQTNLGTIYYEGKYISRDINKSIYYYSLAANQNYVIAQTNLGIIYYEGKYISRDINKAIHYFTLAANQNHASAQYLLGFIFFTENYNHENAKKGRYYLMMASKNRYKEAHFHVGFLYHEGKYVDQDIEKAVHYYKEGSSFNDQYAKNNLGIIYKNGFHDKIQPKIGLAIEYFEEAIRQKNDAVSMYNLSNIYMYDERVNQNIAKSIEMLIKSFNQGFQPSIVLLSIELIKKTINFNNFNYAKIKEEIDKYKDTTDKLKMGIQQIIFFFKLYDANIFEEIYNNYRKIEYLYDITLCPIASNKMVIRNKKDPPPGIKLPPPISSLFYEGFGIEI
ncbi:hypothetical protein M9Y10_001328 [Tritrichomonas musculus]|uniref:Protein kinase domain-containing protein n=1 Tax=Tritrichomonas musculus TaxID=1915356 RepID=A0ABR2L7R0_9EUKA